MQFARRRPTRVRTRALAAVLVPIVGCAFAASTIVRTSQRRAARVAQASAAIDVFLSVDQLTLQLRSEGDLAVAIAEEHDAGADEFAMSARFGVDVTALYRRSRDGTTQALARLPKLPSTMRLFDTVTANRPADGEMVDATTLRSRYAIAVDALELAARRTEADVTRALANVGDAGGIATLVIAVANLDEYNWLAADELGELSRQAMPPGSTPIVARIDLDTNHAQQGRVTNLIAEGLPESYQAQWRTLLGSVPFVRFAAMRNTITSDSLPGVGNDASQGATLLVDLVGAGLERNDALVSFVQRLGDDVHRTTKAIGDASAQRVRQLTIVAALAGALALALTAATVRALTTPLHRLLDVAREIASGRLADAEVPRSGPREVVELAEVVGVLSHNLAAIDAHARALAEGRLDDAAIPSSLPGGIGSLLQVTMDRLVGETARLAHQANHDTLTGLYNRSAILAELEDVARRARRGDAGAIVFVDLDGFKIVNDRHGHDVGDELLRAVADRLVRATAEQHRVGRLGGDEFVIVARGATDAADLGERLLDCFREPFALSVGAVPLKASIGISRCDARTEPAEILRRADQAAYEAKRAGKARVVVG